MASAGHPRALPSPLPRLNRAAALSLVRRVLAVASLGGLALCAWTIASGAAYRPTPLVPGRQGGFPFWVRGPLSDLGAYLSYPDFAAWGLAMCGVWLVALVTVPALRLGWTVGAVVALHVLFVLAPPLLSADIFGYIDWARMGVLHGLSPYETDSGAVVSDPAYPFVRWDSLTTPYGPLFTLFTYALVPLGLPLNLWAMKLSVLAASLGCAALLWACARELGRDPRLGLVLYGLNPAVLIYAVGGVHNDVYMMVAVLAGVWLVLRGRERTGAVAATLGVAVKLTAGIATVFLVLGARDRARTLAAALAAAVTALAAGIAVFGLRSLEFVYVLRVQQELDSGTTVIAQLGRLGGWQGNPMGARIVASVVFAGVVGGLLWRTWRARETWLDSAGWATATLMACTSWLLAWYVVWLAPLAALARSRALVPVAAAFTLFVMLTRLVPFL